MLTEEQRADHKKAYNKKWKEQNRERYNQYQREWQRRRREEFNKLKANQTTNTDSPSADAEEKI